MTPSRRTMIFGGVALTAVLSQGAPAVLAATPYDHFQGSPPPPFKGLVRKAYVDSTYGQLHYHHVQPRPPTTKTAIVFFHPNPFSGGYFDYTLEELGTDRTAIAFDTPGYGESAAPPKPQTIEELSACFAQGLRAMGYGPDRQVDVSGFHTGAYIAIEMAAAYPDLVRRVVLSGTPFWEGELLASKKRSTLVEEPLNDDGSYFQKEWNSWAAHRNKMLPIERGAYLAAQGVIPGKKIWWAYYGVVNYMPRPRIAKVQQPVLSVIPSGKEMQETTRAAAALFKNGKILEVPHLPHQIYDLAVPAVGKIYRDFLDA